MFLHCFNHLANHNLIIFNVSTFCHFTYKPLLPHNKLLNFKHKTFLDTTKRVCVVCFFFQMIEWNKFKENHKVASINLEICTLCLLTIVSYDTTCLFQCVSHPFVFHTHKNIQLQKYYFINIVSWKFSVHLKQVYEQWWTFDNNLKFQVKIIRIFFFVLR